MKLIYPPRKRSLENALGIATQELLDFAKVERHVLNRLGQLRTLLILDNAEPLVQAIAANSQEAVDLAQFLREQLPKSTVSLLVTSRSYLGWSNEVGFELEGLATLDGISLFKQHAPQRTKEIEEDRMLLWTLCEKVEGHPLSLHLLGSTFNMSDLPLNIFVKEYEAQLFQAENKYAGVDHRHRTLYASIETSTRNLNTDLRRLFSRLWLFHAPFTPVVATAVFDPVHDSDQEDHPLIQEQLHTLWRHGLLLHETVQLGDDTEQFYRVLPTIRIYIEHYLSQREEREQLLSQFGQAYALLTVSLWRQLGRTSAVQYLANLLYEDLERGMICVTGIAQGYYYLDWGWVVHELGNRKRGLGLIEKALEIAQEQNDQQLTIHALNHIALANYRMGQPKQAIALSEQLLPLIREAGDSIGEVATLDTMALAYTDLGQPERALKLFEQVLLSVRESGDRTREGIILSNIAKIYQDMGKRQQAKELGKQALSIRQEMGDWAGVATVLGQLASIYYKEEQWNQALEMLEQALSIKRELGDTVGEVLELHNIAAIYQQLNQPEQALQIYEQILPHRHELGDFVGEVATLFNMAEIYLITRQWQQAIGLYEQALQIQRKVPDVVDIVPILSKMADIYTITEQTQEALQVLEKLLAVQIKGNDRRSIVVTLNHMGILYRTDDQYDQALERYEQALPIARELDDRDLEATTLNNMALIFRYMQRVERALESFQSVLLLWRELGNREGEASTLNNMAFAYQSIGQPERSLELYEEALPIAHASGQAAVEVTLLFNTALVLYQHLGRANEAIKRLKQAVAVLKLYDLPRDSAGHTEEDLFHVLRIMNAGVSIEGAVSYHGSIPPSNIQSLVANTVIAMTTTRSQRVQWREAVEGALRENQRRGAIQQVEVDFFTAILALLDGQPSSLPADHPYSPALAEIQASVVTDDQPEEFEADPNDGQYLIFNSGLVPNSITALLGGSEYKIAHAQYLTAMSAQTTDEGLRALIQNIMFALFGGDITRLGQSLEGVYRKIWEVIVQGVEAGGKKPLLLRQVVQLTLAVFRPQLDEGRKSTWQDLLLQAEVKAIEDGDDGLASLLDSVNRLLDTNGNPTGLGTNLTGIYAQTWQEILEGLTSN